MRRKVHMRAGVGAYSETPICTPNGATLCDVTDDPKLVTCAHCRVRLAPETVEPRDSMRLRAADWTTRVR